MPYTTTLRITTEDVTPEQHSAIVQSLRDAGIRQDQINMSTTEDDPHGWLLWLSALLALAMVALLLAWIWVGDGRYGATAGVILPVALGTFVASFGGRR